MTIDTLLPQDAVSNEYLLNAAFGPGRHEKAAARLRNGLEMLPNLGLCVRNEGRLIGSIAFWPIQVGGNAAVLLGPLAVEPGRQGLGIGKALIAAGLQRAHDLGHRLCILVGDPAYYMPFGFRPTAGSGMVMPGNPDPKRLLALSLQDRARLGVAGLITGARA
ncbi:MAG: N-acetyltransferase [Sneathiellaceae bacterium]